MSSRMTVSLFVEVSHYERDHQCLRHVPLRADADR